MECKCFKYVGFISVNDDTFNSYVYLRCIEYFLF